MYLEEFKISSLRTKYNISSKSLCGVTHLIESRQTMSLFKLVSFMFFETIILNYLPRSQLMSAVTLGETKSYKIK